MIVRDFRRAGAYEKPLLPPEPPKEAEPEVADYPYLGGIWPLV